MNNEFISGFEKSAGVSSWLGKVTGISKYRAGKAAIKKTLPGMKEGIEEMNSLGKDILNRRREMKNRISVLSGRKASHNNIPSDVSGLSSKKLQEEINVLKGFVGDTKKHYQPSMDNFAKAKKLKSEGVNRMWLTGGITGGVGLGATALALRKRKEETNNNFKQAIS